MTQPVKAQTSAALAEWLGLTAERLDNTTFRMTFSEKHVGNPAKCALHGGVIGAFLEVAAQYELERLVKSDCSISLINLDIDYLATSSAADMFAMATAKRIGRRIAFVEAIGWQTDESAPIAVGRFRFKIKSTH